MIARSRAIAALLLGALALLPTASVAGALDSIAPDPAATVLHNDDTVLVPPNGAVGADVYVSSRAFLSIDFAVQPNKQVTLMVITGEQKRAMDSGGQAAGNPMVRWPIDGTASQSTTIQEPGDYYVAILNSDSAPVSVTYRVSARAF